jgi:hypothetical protein
VERELLGGGGDGGGLEEAAASEGRHWGGVYRGDGCGLWWHPANPHLRGEMWGTRL